MSAQGGGNGQRGELKILPEWILRFPLALAPKIPTGGICEQHVLQHSPLRNTEDPWDPSSQYAPRDVCFQGWGPEVLSVPICHHLRESLGRRYYQPIIETHGPHAKLQLYCTVHREVS